MKNFFIIIFIIISLILFFYTYYQSEVIFDGVNREYYYIYYILSISLFVFFFLSIFLNETFKTYLLIISISTVLSLYIIELSIIIKTYYIDTNSENRTKLEIYKDLKKTNKDVTIVIPPVRYLEEKNKKLFPFSGVSNKKTIFCNENGYYSIYQSDRYGFNNPDNEWDQNEIDYLLIGDSYLHGACVNRPHDIASSLRNISNKKVITLGYSSTGPLVQYATLKEYFIKNTKNIIWFYSESNDHKNLTIELNDNILIKYLENDNFSQNLKSKQKELNKLHKITLEKEFNNENKIVKLRRKAKIASFVKISRIRSEIYNFFKYKTKISIKPVTNPSLEIVMKKVKKLSNSNDINLHFVYLPSLGRYFQNDNYDKHHESVKKIVEKLEINFIDVKHIFENEKNVFNLGRNHYNEKGYDLIVKEIYKFISSNN